MKKLIAAIMTSILLLTIALPVQAAQQIKITVNGKTVTGVTVKSVKNVLYIPMNNSKTVFGTAASATNHTASKTVVVGTGLDQAKKLKAGSTTRLIVNGKTISGVSVPVISGVTYIPLLKVAQELGLQSTWNDKSNTVTINKTSAPSIIGVDSMQLALQGYSDGVTLSASSIKTLTQYQKEFFTANRSALSLDKIAKAISEAEIEKNVAKYQSTVVSLTFLNIDSVAVIKLKNGQSVTRAIGHTGGKYDAMTEKWKESFYFEIYYLGSAKISKGEGVTVKGIPVGKSSVELVNTYGAKYTAPLTTIVAGNLLRSIDEYDIRSKQSQNSGGSISFPELDELDKTQLQRVEFTLSANGLKIFDPFMKGYEVKSVHVGEYTYKPSAGTTIPDMSYDGLVVPLESLKDGSGNALADTSGSFFVKVVTNKGEIMRMIDYEA